MAYTTIDNPELYMQVELYTGTGSSHAVTLDGDEDMAPNLVWIHHRSAAEGPDIYDTVRGVTSRIRTNSNGSETDQSANSLSAFGSDGFTVLTNTAVNSSSAPYVAFCWKETADAGFDIVGYTGNDTARTIAHSLSAVPHMMIIKNTGAPSNDLQDWRVYHHKNTSAPETDYLILNTTAATADNPQFNDTAPTSSVFSVGTATSVNGGGGGGHSMIAYLWSEKQGFSKFGKYTGNGNADGPMIFTGFRPAWIMTKRTDSTGDWLIYDSEREGYNEDNDYLKANANTAEQADVDIDILSNGFKIRNTSNDGNASGGTFIYAAFAEAPFVNSEGVPANAR